MATGTQVDSGCFSGCCTNTKFVKTRATKEYELADAIARFDPETVSKALNKVIKYGARNVCGVAFAHLHIHKNLEFIFSEIQATTQFDFLPCDHENERGSTV